MTGTGRDKVKLHQIYLVLDVSQSMCRKPPGSQESPFQQFGILLDDLLGRLVDDGGIVVQTTCWLGVVAFNDEAHDILAISDLSEIPTHPGLPSGGNTNYTEVMRHLGERIERDASEIKKTFTSREPDRDVNLRPPLIFFITDGEPTERLPAVTWQDRHAVLVSGERGARFAALGLPGSKENTLFDLATGSPTQRNAFIATGELSASQLAEKIIYAILRSVQDSLYSADMVIDVPVGMRRIVKP